MNTMYFYLQLNNFMFCKPKNHEIFIETAILFFKLFGYRIFIVCYKTISTDQKLPHHSDKFCSGQDLMKSFVLQGQWQN